MWDVFAVSTYFTVSVLFWYMGLIPDLATMRDRATTRDPKILLRLFRAWLARLEPALEQLRKGVPDPGRSLDAAGALGAPVVSFDFAMSVMPGWHTTIFPPYFVAGAIFSGFAHGADAAVPARAIFKLQDIITMRHIDMMCKVTLATGSIVGYAYAMEFFIAWYSGNRL